MFRRSLGLTLAAASLIVVPATASAKPMASPQTACDLVASTTGDDAAAGTAQAPLRTVQRLSERLQAGQVGCLRTGTYAEDVSVATPGITLTSSPGERATVKGRFWISQGADRVTVRSLDLNGVNADGLPSPTVNAADATFEDDDVTNDHTNICLMLGSHTWGRALRTTIRHNRIHDCGRLPSNNMEHGIYVAAADDTQILDNVIVDNTDRGIQLYPDAQGTVIRGNVIAGNGEGIIISGADGQAANGSVIENNVVTGSKIRSDVESWYPAANPVGTGNVVRNNCIGTIDTTAGGFTATDNTRTAVSFASAATGDYRVAASSACASVLGASTAPAGPQWEAATTGAAAPAAAPAPVVATPAPAAPAAPAAPVAAPAKVTPAQPKLTAAQRAAAKRKAAAAKRKAAAKRNQLRAKARTRAALRARAAA